MKAYKTFNQQLTILRNRGMIVPTNGTPKRFLEQENYYNVVNGYKELFLQRDDNNNLLSPERFIENTHFDELKNLFLFDRELRILFLEYMLIFENSFKTTLSHEFSRKYPKPNSYLEIQNYYTENPKNVLSQISTMTHTIQQKVDREGAIKHYIENHGEVPFWVLVNFLTIGNICYLYEILKDSDKNAIAKFYSDKFNKQHCYEKQLRISTNDVKTVLKVINIARNICAHDERLYKR